MNGQTMSAHELAWGGYPERDVAGEFPALHDAWRGLRGHLARGRAGALPARHADALASAQARLLTADAAGVEAAVVAVRRTLRRDGFAAEPCVAALGLAAALMTRTLGKTPYPTQLHAAWLILQGRLVEMGTGEGKTLAAALAAAVGALSGRPVHVMTANDYLVQRDHDLLEPFYTALGLSSGCVLPTLSRDARAEVYRRDIVHVTAKELVFDYLRDHLLMHGERDPRMLRALSVDASAAPAPVLPGLCFGVVDEADSILLDEACTPLILSAPSASVDEAGYRRAYDIACSLQHERDYRLLPLQRQALLTETGRERVTQAVVGANGVLAPPRRAHELVEAALAARLLYRRDREYAVTAEGLALIDEVTGRIAQGRRWTGALHQMIELKEALAPSAPMATAAQITYQRFFPRYLHLGGMSGTLLEAAHELRVLYDSGVAPVALARPSRRRWLGERAFTSQGLKWDAVVARVREMVAVARPVLVGTDSVAASQQLSERLRASDIEHQVLNALQNADEAAQIARAGQRGVVTVATNMAGRGTDIRLDDEAAACGGLHVIACMRNRSRRIDRQLIGRCARHGDPGSAEAIVALDDELVARRWPAWVRRAAVACARDGQVPAAVARPLFHAAQRTSEWADRRHRRNLRLADRAAGDLYGFAGRTE
jgi:preprotein translocase subunit SecA